jgi:hypothetical protein
MGVGRNSAGHGKRAAFPPDFAFDFFFAILAITSGRRRLACERSPFQKNKN